MSTERHRRSLFTAIAVMIGCAAALFGGIGVVGEASSAWAPLTATGPLAVSLIVLGAGVHWLVSASAWAQTVRAVTGYRLGLPASSTHVVLTSVGKYVPGKVWGLGLRGAALQRCGVGLGAIAAASAVEQTYLLATGAAVAALSLGLPAGGVAQWAGPTLAIALWMLLASGSVPAWARLLGWLGRISPRLSMASPPPSRLLGIRLTATFTAIWLALGGVFALVAHSVSAVAWSVPGTGMLVGSVTVAYLAGFAAFVPAGLGVREGVGTALLATQGFGPDVALTALLGLRLVTMVVELAAAGLAARALADLARG